MAEDMFDNGSFLRRRKRYKRPSFPGHWSTMLDPYTRKLLSQYTFQHMHGNGGAASHGSGPPGAVPHSNPHPPPPHHSNHMHPNLLPHPMLMSGNNSHHSVGSSNPGELSPTQHPHQGNLPMGLNIPSQNPIIPPHPMIAAAARAAQLVNFPLRPPPPPCSVAFSSAGPFPNSNFSTVIKSPKRTSPENSPPHQFGMPSPGIDSTITPRFSASLNSSKENEYISHKAGLSNAPIMTSSSKSSRGSGFTIDNIIGDQRRNDTSNNNNMVRSDEVSFSEKEDENTLKYEKSSPSIEKDLEKEERVSESGEKDIVKLERDDDESRLVVLDNIDQDIASSHKLKNYEETTKLVHHINTTSNLPSFLQCAMLGKMVSTSTKEDSWK